MVYLINFEPAVAYWSFTPWKCFERKGKL